MKKNFVKLISLVLSLSLVFGFAACNGNEAVNETESTTEYSAVADTNQSVEASSDAQSTEASSAEAQTQELETVEAETVEAATEEAETVADLKNKEYVVELYKKAAAATEKAGVTTDSVLTLISMDGGEGAVGAVIDFFEPIAKAILADNSTTFDGLTGGYEKLTASDVRSHKATVSADGRYTTVVLNLVPQTDGVDGKAEEGTVGHAVSVLDGVGIALDELAKKGVYADYVNGMIKLEYVSPIVNVKIDNDTGKIVSGKWYYRVNVSVDNVEVRLGRFSITLRKAGGVVDYTCMV